MSALKRNREIAICGKQKDCVQREMLALSATMKVSVEKKHNRLVRLQDHRHKMTGKVLRKASLPEAVVPLERVIKDRAEITLTEGHTILGAKAQRAIPKRDSTPRKNSGEGPSQGIQHSEPHERSPYSPKFEDRSEEETLKQERCARRVAWEMARSILKLTDKEKATFYSPSEIWCLPAPSSTKPTER